jgi:surfeit locus 1 family protein
MLSRLRHAGLIWPTAFGAVALAVLLGLGTWQLQRKQWKEGLIAKIAQRVKAPPIRLAADGQLAATPSGDLEYLHVGIEGRFHHDRERYLYAPAKSGLGWHVYTPLELQPDGRIVWVNRGFVPDERRDPATRRQGHPPGKVEVTGIVRVPHGRTAFTPDNDVARNLWYWPDVAAMHGSAFGGATPPVLPFWVDADAAADPAGLPRGGVTRLDLPNRHLEYALTWYGLALTLIGVYTAFAATRLRDTGPA